MCITHIHWMGQCNTWCARFDEHVNLLLYTFVFLHYTCLLWHICRIRISFIIYSLDIPLQDGIKATSISLALLFIAEIHKLHATFTTIEHFVCTCVFRLFCRLFCSKKKTKDNLSKKNKRTGDLYWNSAIFLSYFIVNLKKHFQLK